MLKEILEARGKEEFAPKLNEPATKFMEGLLRLADGIAGMGMEERRESYFLLEQFIEDAQSGDFPGIDIPTGKDH